MGTPQANNLLTFNGCQPWPLATLREQPVNFQPVNLGLWPRYANKLLTFNSSRTFNSG
ncbi:hypothetical protein [Moorena producens]|uniref:hypothetical protein n=1 Tax=Moorena producens TaxID=1155739 RepID=UPI003C722F56